jgi:hypothetical protein
MTQGPWLFMDGSYRKGSMLQQSSPKALRFALFIALILPIFDKILYFIVIHIITY